VISINLPEWEAWLDEPVAEDGEPVRHRVLFGGRGGGKSRTIAYKLVERALLSKQRILCTREVQNSIRDSSKKLIEDVIDLMGLGARGTRLFTVTANEIRARNGSTFSFMGLNGKDSAIKSLEGYTLVWVEEAASVSQASIDALVPTIRAEGSEIWWSYNPRYATDPVDRMFRGAHKPPGSIVIEVYHYDNPWFPGVLKRDMEYDRQRDPEKYAHIWLGQYIQRSEARIFNNWREHYFEAPADARFRFGADFGFAKDPTGLLRCFIGRWEGVPYESAIIADPNGRCIFVDQEAYAVGCPIVELPALFAGSDVRRPARWGNPDLHPRIDGALRFEITADSSRPETIDHLTRLGFNIRGAIKGPRSIEDGIEYLKGYDI
jgi:phage terminase large subunit